MPHNQFTQFHERNRTTLYEAVGLQLTATSGEIGDAYRRHLASHPDYNPQVSLAKYKIEQEAFKILSQPDLRVLYDIWLGEQRQPRSRLKRATGNEIRLGDDEFAVRFQEDVLRKLYRNEIPINRGYSDLLLQGGELYRVIPPDVGSYALMYFWPTLKSGPRKEMVRVRSREVTLDLILSGLFPTDDRQELDVRVDLQLKPGAEQLFYDNLMGDAGRVTLLDLRAHTFPPLRDVVSQWFYRHIAERIPFDRSDLNSTAMEALNQSLANKGLTVVGVR